MKISIQELKNKIHSLTADDKFVVKFRKVNGEEREYEGRVGVHIVNENATRKGISAKSHENNYDNLLFYCDADCKYRIAKYCNIISITIDNQLFEIAQ